jgi:hypothetical protein
MEFTLRSEFEVKMLVELLEEKIEIIFDGNSNEEILENEEVYSEFSSYNKMFDRLVEEGVLQEPEGLGCLVGGRNFWKINQ